MVITLADWQFRVDVQETFDYTSKCSQDHCTCPYCRNFYKNLDNFSNLRPVLQRFGVYADGPCEVMPFEPTLVAACYRVTGQVVKRGEAELYIDHIPLRPEEADEATFFLWIGPMELPWTQEEDMNEVISPANQPEFLDRMMQRLLRWAEDSEIEN